IGFIFYPGSKRFAGDLDAGWAAQLQGVRKTGVFVNADIGEVESAVRRYGLQAVQLHGEESALYCTGLKDVLRDGNVEIIKAFGVDEGFDWDVVDAFDTAVDYYLFDTKSAQHGGTGIRFNWQLLDGYKATKPFFLSGGLSAGNIGDALALTDGRLYGLDLNSKFETSPGTKDIELLKRTLESINDE